MRRLLPVLLFGILWPGAALRAAEVDYLRDVKPILKHHCYSCHGALKQESKLRLDTAASARKGGRHGPAIPELVKRITSADASFRMPQESKPLSDKEIATLKAWVGQGGIGPADEQPEADPSKHWAFQPVVRPAVPAVTNASW